MTLWLHSYKLFFGQTAVFENTPHHAVHALLRFSCAFCFIGHGAWGIITKAGWLPFFSIFGIPENVAWTMMPAVGTFDILVGLSILFFPTRATLLWMTVWATITALLRPLAGMGGWEFLERAGNYGPPLALLVIAMSSTQGQQGWFSKIEVEPLSERAIKNAKWILKASIALLLIGHGGFGAFQAKSMLLDHWQSVGIPATASLVRVIGSFEILLGILFFIYPKKWLILGILYWKIGTELLYPIAGSLIDIWEWVERAGDYFAPLTLLVLLYCYPDKDTAKPSSTSPSL